MTDFKNYISFKEFLDLIVKFFIKNPAKEISWTEYRKFNGLKQKAIANKWIKKLEEMGLVRIKKKGRTLWSWPNISDFIKTDYPKLKAKKTSLSKWL